MSSERASKHSRMSGRQIPSAIARHEHRDEAVALGRQHRRAVGGERHAERVERLLVRRIRPPRGIRRDATNATNSAGDATPTPHVLEHELPPDEVVARSAAAVNASTAGSARPSLSPDSRLSECRIIRGTRGLVTTVDESTGSVGDSSAPTRNDSVQPRSVSAWRPAPPARA